MLNNCLQEALENFNIAKYSYLFEDNKNIFMVEEVIVCNKDDLGLFLDMFKLESNIDKISEGNFSMKVNDKYTIVYDSLKLQLKEIVKNFLFPLRNYLKEIFKLFQSDSNISCVFKYLRNIITFVNFILLFSPEFSTLYNLKKEILCEIMYKNLDIEDLIFSEFLFVNILNEKFRNCSISWDYRYFLTKSFYSKFSFPSSFFKIYFEEKISTIKRKLKDILEIFRIKVNSFDEDLDNSRFLFLDLYLTEKINEKEKRNYNLWKYIVHLFDIYSRDLHKNLSETVLIYSFCLFNFLKNTLDYSAYSNLINFHKKLKSHFTKEEVVELKLYLIKIRSLIEDEKIKYLKNYIDEILI